MISSLQKHLPKIVLRHKIAAFVLVIGAVLTLRFHGQLGSLLAAATSSLTTAPTVLFLTPYEEKTLNTKDIVDIDVNIQTRVPINALEATIKFPPEDLEIVGIHKKRSFLDLWTEETVIKEDMGELHFSGGTTRIGGMVGTGTVLTLSVRTKKPGSAKVYFLSSQILAHDGKGTALSHDYRSYTITTQEKPVASTPPPASSGASVPAPQPPNPDLDDNGKINLIDVSILTVHLVGSYAPRYDLDMNGSIGISDLSVLFAKMREN